MRPPHERSDIMGHDRSVLDAKRLGPSALTHIDRKDLVLGARDMVIFTRQRSSE